MTESEDFLLENDRIIIENTRDFDIGQILNCGQTFRWRRTADGWEILAADRRCVVTQNAARAVITGDPAYFAVYFDLANDYGAIKRGLAGKPMMREAVAYGGGIRILRQDIWETLVTFIVSANNHIPRIKGIVARLCEALGQPMDGYHAFPTAAAMAARNAAFYERLGAGYRAPYLAETARAVADGFDLRSIDALDGESANRRLCELPGVGPKVADCVLLFGYHKADVFPVDTWIRKVYADVCGGAGTNKTMRARLLDLYGPYAGYAQQYLFFRKRTERG